MTNLIKYPKISSAKYTWEFGFELCDILSFLGWEILCRAGNSIEARHENGLEVHFSGYGDNKSLYLTKNNYSIGDCTLCHETTTQGILDILDHYGKMSRLEIEKHHLLTAWQNTFFYKNIVRGEWKIERDQ